MLAGRGFVATSGRLTLDCSFDKARLLYVLAHGGPGALPRHISADVRCGVIPEAEIQVSNSFPGI